MNLAVNARDAMPSGGKLVDRDENVELDAATRDGIRAGAGPLRAAHGERHRRRHGRPQTWRASFEPFFTTKPKAKAPGSDWRPSTASSSSGGDIAVSSEVGPRQPHSTLDSLWRIDSRRRPRGAARPRVWRRPSPKAAKPSCSSKTRTFATLHPAPPSSSATGYKVPESGSARRSGGSLEGVRAADFLGPDRCRHAGDGWSVLIAQFKQTRPAWRR